MKLYTILILCNGKAQFVHYWAYNSDAAKRSATKDVARAMSVSEYRVTAIVKARR